MQIKRIFVDICIYLNLLGWLSLVWGLIADPPPTNKHLKLALLVHFWHEPLLLSSMLLCDFCSLGIQSTPRVSSHLFDSDIQGLPPGYNPQFFCFHTWLNILMAVQGQDLGHSSWKTTTHTSFSESLWVWRNWNDEELTFYFGACCKTIASRALGCVYFLMRRVYLRWCRIPLLITSTGLCCSRGICSTLPGHALHWGWLP